MLVQPEKQEDSSFFVCNHEQAIKFNLKHKLKKMRNINNALNGYKTKQVRKLFQIDSGIGCLHLTVPTQKRLVHVKTSIKNR